MMLKSLLSSAQRTHLARTHLFVTPKGTLRQNKFWADTMESDVLVYDFCNGVCHDRVCLYVSVRSCL